MPGFWDKVNGGQNKETIAQRAAANQAKYEQSMGVKAPEEEAAEEGDITDYVMPIEGLGRNIVKAVAEKGVKVAAKAGAKALAKEGVKDVEKVAVNEVKDLAKKALKPEIEGPNYKGENIAFRPTQPGKQVGWDRFSGKK